MATLLIIGVLGVLRQLDYMKKKDLGFNQDQILIVPLKGDLKETPQVLRANLFAWPVAYYALTKWLQSFAYRTSLGFGMFLLSSVLALMIAWMTVGWQSIKAARSNPADAIRHE